MPYEAVDNFAEYLSASGIKYNVVMRDIGSMIDQQNFIHKFRPSAVNADDFAYDKYHTIEDIHAWIDQMVQTYPDLATSFTVGQSYEKRDLKGLKISSKKAAVKLDGTPVNAKKAVWWDGGKRVRYISHDYLKRVISRYSCSRMD